MIILPVGHEQTTVRRWPWVTFGIIALCFAAFAAQRVASTQQAEAERHFEEVMVFYSQHPYLELDRDLISLIFSTTPDHEEEMAEVLRGYLDEIPAPPRNLLRRQQEKLDEMTAELLRQIREQPIFRWGLVPADVRAVTLLTYMFLHAGWLHLLGNLFYLYLTAPFIEDVWGRPAFAIFYLFSGVVAAALYAAQYGHLQVPLIGASGAVAGVMGAFMVRYARTRIKFFYFAWFFRFFVGTFEAPALIMLLLWLGGELLSAYVADWLAPGSGGSGVAHWAHVWGFGFGVLGAVVVGALGVEKRHHEHVSADDLDNTVVEQAHQSIAEGRRDEAWTLLTEEVRRQPSNRDATQALWDLALRLERTAEAAPAFARSVRDELAEGEVELALFHWQELSEREPGFSPDLALRLKLAEAFAERGERAEARDLVQVAVFEIDGDVGVGIVVRLVRLAAELDTDLGQKALAAALENPYLPPELRRELEQQRASFATADAVRQRFAVAASAAAVPPPPILDDGGFGEMPAPAAVRWKLKVLEGVPRAFEAGALVLSMDGGKSARLGLAKIRAVAVAVIRETEASLPYLVIDLFLDTPGFTAGQLRVVRCLSRTFDPRKLLPGAAAEMPVNAAFQQLVERLLKESGAVPLLGSDRFGRQQLRVFPSLESYQASLSG